MMKRIKIFGLVIAAFFMSALFPLGAVNANGGNRRIKPVPKCFSQEQTILFIPMEGGVLTNIA